MANLIAKVGLERWARLKFQFNRSTMELMASAKTAHDRRMIAIVALLEVDPTERYTSIPEEETRYIKECHRYIESLELRPKRKIRYSLQ